MAQRQPHPEMPPSVPQYALTGVGLAAFCASRPAQPWLGGRSLQLLLENRAERLEPDLLFEPFGAVEQRPDIVQVMPGVVPLNPLGLAGGLGVAIHRLVA